MNQLNFSIRVRVPVIDMDRTSANIKQREVMAILRGAFKGAMRKGNRDVTLWDSYGHCLAHYCSEPKPTDKKQTIASCFKNPLGR